MWYTVGAILMFGVIGFMIGYPIITAEKPQIQTVEIKQPEKIQYESKKVEIKETTAITRTQSINQIEKKIHDFVNEERRKNGVRQLEWNESVAMTARKHSQDMGINDYFSHTSSDGKSPYDRFVDDGLRCRYLGGENIYMTEYFSDDETKIVVEKWMDSSLHRINLLDDRYTSQGIGVYITLDNMGYVTQNFC